MFKELIEKRNKAYKEYEEMQYKVDPFFGKCFEAEENIKKEFIKQKMYIPIDNLLKCLKKHNAKELTIVFANGDTKTLKHEVGITFIKAEIIDGKIFPRRRIESFIDSDSYKFAYDINKENIVGFYNLILDNYEKVKETFMEEIIKDKE